MVKHLLLLIIMLMCGLANTQDIHFSQFYNSPLNLSPGKTGVFNGTHRLAAGYRTQWRTLPVPWTTFTAAYDLKFIPKYCPKPKSFFSVGLLFNHDQASDLSDLTLSNFNLLGSYTALINPENLITFGALIGYAGRGFDQNSLTFDKQWNTNNFFFDNTFTSGENFEALKINFLETGLGINYRHQKDYRTKLDVSVGVFHLTRPDVGFKNDIDASLSSRYTLSAIGSRELNSKLDLQLHGLAQFQGPYREFIFGGLGKIYVSNDYGKAVEVHLGLSYRTSKSLIPVIAFQWNNVYASASYDIDMTAFQDIKDTRLNALEFHFRYLIVYPHRDLKICPIY